MSKNSDDSGSLNDQAPTTDFSTEGDKGEMGNNHVANSGREGDFDAQRKELAEAFGRTIDPLEEFEETFQAVNVDVFAGFFNDVLDQQNPDDDTRDQYEMTFRQWRDHMEEQGRHPACPNEDHVKAFIDSELAPEDEDGKHNHPRTVKEKLRKLNRVYEYWQREQPFPHPTDYNPFAAARAKRRGALTPPEEKEHPRIPLEELREMMDSVTDIRRRAIIGLGFKLGLRAGEVGNIQLSDINLTSAEVARHHPNLGTHVGISDYENAIYIPPADERDGNKSVRPRVLPLDDETRQLLLRYLLIRPDAGEPWLFLSKKSHSEIDAKVVNKQWKKAFHPEYAETEDQKGVTSHFGRHRFSTFWRISQDVPRELVQYMRGDVLGEGSVNHRDALDSYLHAYYEDIEEIYRENIYKLGL